MHCTTSWKVAGSILNGVIGIFHRLNPSGRTVALGSAQPLVALGSAQPLVALGSAQPLVALGSAQLLVALGSAQPLTAVPVVVPRG
jgi:hypothetical protein